MSISNLKVVLKRANISLSNMEFYSDYYKSFFDYQKIIRNDCAMDKRDSRRIKKWN